jgi:hypothetical protein
VGVKLGQTANNSQPAMPALKVQANADVTAEVDITAPDATKAL